MMGSSGWLLSQKQVGTEAGKHAVQDKSPPNRPASFHGGRMGFSQVESQRKCDMWQGTQGLWRFSFCPDGWQIFPNHLAATLEMSICVNLMNCRSCGVLPRTLRR